ncbi:hypothetical protein FOTG_15612 [Fusarium oxysporum f. sp. vasinfectum 25433]|uniref:Uncharacterized protein n=1 Tax=Fusarium oxysporum f. sp. vasinfectum 25433 TaxID=1089449 RepID=X0L4T6_FUSOX|nr:hypothetical protein FOTG_15612 [Fusarium oxysporum f. sp. vasinfectum 25433]
MDTTESFEATRADVPGDTRRSTAVTQLHSSERN